MITASQVAAAIQVVIALAAIAAIGWLFRDYRIDKIRDELFALRDELFLYAVEKSLLDHPAHQQLRENFNAMIRFSHKLSLTRLLLTLVYVRLFAPHDSRVDLGLHSRWKASVSTLPEEQREALVRFHQQMFVSVMRFMVNGFMLNPPAIVMLACFSIYHLVKKVGASAYELMAGKTPGLGLLEEQALRAAKR
jgi:hypothetical protein